MIRATQPGRALPAAVGGCFILTAALGLASQGVYQDDDLTHFLFARWAKWFPSYLLHVWGRPGLTVPLSTVSGIGNVDSAWHNARLLSAVVTAMSALVAARLAGRLGVRRPWVVVLLCYAQPLATVLAITTLTENFAGLYLIGAIALYKSKRLVSGSVVFSLLLVTRHEAAALWPIWIIALVASEGSRAGKTGAAILSLLAPIVHNVLFFLVFGAWPFSIFGHATGSTEYPAAGALAFVPDALHAMTPAILAMGIIGGVALWRRGQWLIPSMAGAFLMTHITIRGVGVFASGGYGRFMVTIAPLVAILAAAAWEEIEAMGRERRGARWPWMVFAGVWIVGLVALEQQLQSGRFALEERVVWSMRVSVAALVVLALWLAPARRTIWARRAGLGVFGLTALAQWIVMVTPLSERADQRFTREVATWIDRRGMSGGPFFATNPWFALHLDLIENPRAHKGPTLLASMPVGTVVIWDSKYSDSDFHGIGLDSLRENPHYELLSVFRSESERRLDVWVFKKAMETPPPDRPDAPYPPNPSALGTVRGVYYIRP